MSDRVPPTASELLRKLDEQAWAGPWRVDDPMDGESSVIGIVPTNDPEVTLAMDIAPEDARLIAALRNALPEIRALVEAAERTDLYAGSTWQELQPVLTALAVRLEEQA